MKKELNYEIGERIRAAREALGLSRELTAEMVGITPLFLGYIECGRRGMSIETFYNLCKSLNVSADYLIFGNKNDNADKMDMVKNAIENTDDDFFEYALECIYNAKKLYIKMKNNEKPL